GVRRLVRRARVGDAVDGNQLRIRAVGPPAAGCPRRTGSLPQRLRYRRKAAPTGWLGSRHRQVRKTLTEGPGMTTESAAPPQPAPAAPVSTIPETVARLRRTFATGRTRNVEWRKQQLLALEKMMVENEATIAKALASDLDRSPFEAWLADSASTAAEARF